MKIKNYTYPLKEFGLKHIEELLKPGDLFVDIETTGFLPARCHVYLIGTGYLSNDFVTVQLFYAQTKEEEKEILSAFSDLCKKFDRLITFNGEGFDLSFLKTRFERYDLICDFLRLNSLDLFKEAKKYRHYLNLQHYKQKDLECFFGRFREDEYSGGELIDIYKKQSSLPTKDEEDLLFLHNLEDVKGMVQLLCVLDFSILENNAPTIDKIRIDEKELSFFGHYDTELNLDFKLIKNEIYFKINEKGICGSIPLSDKKFKYYLPNFKDYFYVEDEALLLPKALKHTVDKDRIRKAKKEECFVLTDPNALSKEKLGEYVKQILNDK